MDIRMLGSYGGVPSSEDACSSFLLELEKGNILVECGSGVVSSLLAYSDLKSLKAIFISHLHFDHFNDLFTLYYAYKVGIARGELEHLTVYIPKDSGKTLNYLISSLGDVFNFAVYTEEDAVELLGVQVTFCKTAHDELTYAMRFEQDDYVIGYTADTGYAQHVVNFLYCSDVLVSECSLLSTLPKNDNHMTVAEAMQMAFEVGASCTILTHMWYTIPVGEYHAEMVGILQDKEEYVLSGNEFRFSTKGMQLNKQDIIIN